MTTELERTEEAAQQAQYVAVLDEQKAGDALGERDRVHEQIAETEREMGDLQVRVRAVDPANDKALGRLAGERAALEVRREALVARSERAEKAHQEAVEALSAARAKLQEAEDAREAAQRAEAKKRLEGVIDNDLKEVLDNLNRSARPYLDKLGFSDILSYAEELSVQRRQEEARRALEEREAQRWAALSPDEQLYETVREEYSGLRTPTPDVVMCLEALRSGTEEERKIARKHLARPWVPFTPDEDAILHGREGRDSAPGVEVVELPDGARVVGGVVLRPLSDPEMGYRVHRELEKREKEAYANLGGEDFNDA
jgi:hypothetical protein